MLGQDYKYRLNRYYSVAVITDNKGNPMNPELQVNLFKLASLFQESDMIGPSSPCSRHVAMRAALIVVNNFELVPWGESGILQDYKDCIVEEYVNTIKPDMNIYGWEGA